jgi:8-oxo-dGTP pyrophosphatase MutT (NUDIX family)
MDMIPPSCLSNRDAFLDLIADKLAQAPIDYYEKAQGSCAVPNLPTDRRTAGVLLLMKFEEPSSGLSDGGFYFLLIKRSANIAQPGDLSCPGGMLNQTWDQLGGRLIRKGCLPNLRGKGLTYAKRRDGETYRLITLYLANALREAWEEIGLSPFNIRFLGPLSTYGLILFQRTIFPLVGFIKHPWRFCTNHEVEQIIEIPLTAFYDEANFARYVIGYRNPQQSGEFQYGEFPCLICRDDLGCEQILWGATFHIIVNFLKTIVDYQLPPWYLQRTIERNLPDNYTQGTDC